MPRAQSKTSYSSKYRKRVWAAAAATWIDCQDQVRAPVRGGFGLFELEEQGTCIHTVGMAKLLDSPSYAFVAMSSLQR
jgi:hypothetical protein